MVSSADIRTDGHPITFHHNGPVDITLPLSGTPATLAGVETLANKTLSDATITNAEIAGAEITDPTIERPLISGGLTASGSTANTFAGSTGTFITSTGANTLSGDVSIAAGKDITYVSGDGKFDGSLGTGIFKTTTGAGTYGCSSNTFTNAITPSGGIAAGGGFSFNPKGIHVGQQPAATTSDGFDATPSTSETYVSQIFVPANCTITGIALFNGSDVTGNVTVGLANSAGAPIAAAKSASTAGAGTDAYQLIPFAVAYAANGPATYFIQVQYNSGTAKYNAHVLGTHGVLVQTIQAYGTFASFTPPTTFVTNVSNICGLY